VAHVEPRPRAELAEFEEYFSFIDGLAGYLPNAYLTLGIHPELLAGWIQFSKALQGLSGVDKGLEVLMSHLSSSAVGCRFCEAHTSHTAANVGVDDEKIAAVWEFERSPLFGEAERAALRLARDMVQVPSAVTAQHFADLRQHFDDRQIVEMVAQVCSFGFWNRWNDTMATDLEQPVHRVAAALLADRGWTPGKHTVEGADPVRPA
jgi:alkylhydroperoxidase family enzyme